MILKLINNLTKKVYEFPVNDKETSRNFFHFQLKLKKGTDDGEYTYILLDGDSELARGILQVGDYTAISTAYTKNNTYQQYKG